MAVKHGNLAIIQVFPEVAYNTALTSYAPAGCVNLYDVCNIKPMNDAIEAQVKTCLPYPSPIKTAAGREKSELSLAGDFTDPIKMFFNSFLSDGTVTDTWKASDIAYAQAPSFSFIRMLKTSGVSASSTVDVATGACLTAFKLDCSGPLVKYEATFALAAYTPDVATSTLTGYVGPACATTHLPYKTGEITAISLYNGSITSFNTLNLDVTVEYNNEESQFANSLTRQNMLLSKVTGSLSYESIMNAVRAQSAAINNPADFATKGGFALTLNQTASDFAITGNGVVSSLEEPDAENEYFQLSCSQSLAGTATDQALQIIRT